MQRESRREIFAFLVITASAFLFVCLATHDPRDTLGVEGPPRNACGPVGMFVSYQVATWLGSTGAYALATIIGLAGLALFFRHRIEEWGWKLLGAALLVLAIASIEVAMSDDWRFPDSLPGGYYGQFFYKVLLGQLSNAGTYLLLSFVMLVAFIISTDTVLYPAFARAGGVVLDPDLWERAARTVQKSAAAIHLPRIRFPRPRITWERSAPGEKAPKARRRERETTAEPDQLLEAAAAAKAPGVKRPKKAADGQDGDAVDEDTEDLTGAAQEIVRQAAGRMAEKDDPTPVAGSTPEPAKQEARPPLKIREPGVRPYVPKKKAPGPAKSGPYVLPAMDLLDLPSQSTSPLDRSILEQTAGKIEETLRHFKIEARVVEVQKGPTITQYEVSLAAGIKVHKIINLSDDLAMALKAPSIRIVAPIPGKSTVGVEVPNKSRSTVGLRELLESPEFRDEDFNLPLALGKDVAGNPVIGDLGEMPHLLIAGSTGSGKSVCINSIIINLLLTRTPEEVKLILVDPKMVELAQFENIPHLLAPVVTDMKKAPAILGWTVDKMEERYELLATTGVRHISAYNALGKDKLRERLQGKVDEADMDDFPTSLPFIIVIIDELADLMMTSSKEVEASITRLSQKSRAVGIHVILATQRPSVDVITGLIKANMPSRISFHVASKVDSRTILDRNGAEKLLGKGDMLYLPPGTSALQRVQGTFISDREIRDVVKSAVQQAEPQFSPELTRFGAASAAEGSEQDELHEQAVRIVLGSQRGSVTLLQRQLQIGYTRASRLMEIMHEHGLVGPFKGSKAREVYYTLEEWETANAKRQPGSGGRTEEVEDPAPEGDPGQHDQPGLSEEHG